MDRSRAVNVRPLPRRVAGRENRTKILSVRFTASEWAEIQADAQKYGVRPTGLVRWRVGFDL